MAVLPIYLVGAEILHKKARPIEQIDSDIIHLAYDMMDTMHNANGVGLAANQVGILKRIITIDISGTDEAEGTKPLVLINPEILSEDGESVMEEGCLSLPELRNEVTRADTIRVRFRDINFHQHEMEAVGFLSRVIQHEIDHLNGIVFIDHLSATKRRLLRSRVLKIKKGEVETSYPVATSVIA